MSIQVVTENLATPTEIQAAQKPAEGDGKASNEVTPSAPADSKESGEQNKEAQESETEGKEDKESETEQETEGSDDHPKEGEDSEQAAKDEKPKKKNGIQRRVDKLNARISAAQQEAEFWKQQALKGVNESKPAPTVDSKPAAADGEPQPDQYETHAEFVKAVARWAAKQERQSQDQDANKKRVEIEQANLSKTYSERAEAFAETHEDFNDLVAENLSDVPKSLAVEQVVLSAENGPELLYELAKNPKEARRICSLPASLAYMEMGRIQERLASKASQASKTETKKISNAPKPIAPVGGGGKASVPKTLDEAANSSFAEFKRMREEQLKRRRAQ